MTSLIGVVSIVCILVGCIMLLNLIQKAFDREGVVWGGIAILYPVGTYLYCRKNWEIYRRPFITINTLIAIGVVFVIMLRFIL